MMIVKAEANKGKAVTHGVEQGVMARKPQLEMERWFLPHPKHDLYPRQCLHVFVFL